MIFSARYHTGRGEVLEARSGSWVGRPAQELEQVFALFEPINDIHHLRWYVYGVSHDAVAIQYEKLPEVVRLAYMLSQ